MTDKNTAEWLLKARNVVGKIMSDEQFNENSKNISKSVESLFDQPTESLTPMLHIFSVPSTSKKTVSEVVANPELVQTVVMMGDFGDERYKMLRYLGAKMAERKEFGSPIALFLISEAWVATETPKEREEKKPYLPPSQRPDKEEAVIITGCTVDRRHNMLVHRIKRVGKFMMLGQETVMPYKEGSDNIMESPLMDEFYRGWMESSLGKLDPETVRPDGVKGDVNELFKHPIKAD